MSDDLEKLERMCNDLEDRINKIKSGDGIWCSFCGKESQEVEKIIKSPSPDINICNECVDIAYSIVHEDIK